VEFFDLYDEKRRPLNRLHERGQPLGEGEYLLAVGVWVFDSRNHILLTRRSPEKKYAPNTWENTGGHAMAGEESAVAAARELWEETGIKADPKELIWIGSSRAWPYFGDDYALRRDVALEEIRLQPGETCDARWVSEEQLDEMIASDGVAPSVAAHLAPLREQFNRILRGGNRS
jgi:8-oxo-dGTP diphosphatase